MKLPRFVKNKGNRSFRNKRGYLDGSFSMQASPQNLFEGWNSSMGFYLKIWSDRIEFGEGDGGLPGGWDDEEPPQSSIDL